ALVVVGGTAAPSSAVAAEGDPDDFCSYSPDYPFGWSFNEACEGHDTCIAGLPAGITLLERLACDDTFFDDLLESSHHGLEGACAQRRVGSLLADPYHSVVRFATLLTWGAIDFPLSGPARTESPTSGAPGPRS